MRLSDLKPNQSAIVKEMSRLQPMVRKKLMIMGLLPDTSIRMIRRAPLGDPIMLRFRGVDVALQCEVAERIQVELSNDI
ncbi:FeoA family protein [Halomonas cupida]